MNESQLDSYFLMLEHGIVPVRATKFADVETGLKRSQFNHFKRELTHFEQQRKLSAQIILFWSNACVLYMVLFYICQGYLYEKFSYTLAEK